MSKILIRILAILVMIPIVLFGIGIAIVWNVYLLTNSFIRDIKRNEKKRSN
jgi:CHASE3 domain sensor protein